MTAADERTILRETMARPWLLPPSAWSFLLGLQERVDTPFSAAEKAQLAKIHRQVRNVIDED